MLNGGNAVSTIGRLGADRHFSVIPVAALVCGFAALCYAELASMIPIAGSAYTYAYATLGEFLRGSSAGISFSNTRSPIWRSRSVFPNYLNDLLDNVFHLHLPAGSRISIGPGGVPSGSYFN